MKALKKVWCWIKDLFTYENPGEEPYPYHKTPGNVSRAFTCQVDEDRIVDVKPHHVAIDWSDGKSTTVELQEDVDLFDREHPYFPEIGHPVEVPTLLTLGPTEVIGDAPRRTATTEELFTTTEEQSIFGPEFWRKI